MTSIPPSATPPPLVSAAGPATVSAVLTQVPAGVASASPGTVITGTIAAVDEQGQAILQTKAGPIVLQTSAALSVGEQISLQLQAGGGAMLKATVLVAEALAAADMAAAASTDSTSDATAAPATATSATTVAPSVATGPIIVATVIGPAPVPSPPQAKAQAPSSPPPQSAAAPRPSTSPAATATASPTPPSAPARPGLSPISTTSAGTSAPAAGSSSPPVSSAPATSADSTVEVPPPATSTSTTTPPTTPVPQGAPAASAPASAPASDAGSPSSSLPSTASAASPATATSPAAAGAPPRQLASAIASYTASSASIDGPGLQTSSPASPRSASPLPTPPPGTQVPLRLGGPVTTLASTAASASNGQIVATVVGQTPAGQTIVDTAIGRLAFAAPPMADIAIGQQIALEIAAPAVKPGAEAMAGSPAVAVSRGLPALGAEWPALGAALSTLEKLDPALAERVIQTAAAQPASPRFLGQVLSFLASPAEDVRQLLGQAAVDALQRAGHSDVLTHLDAGLRTMNRLNAAATDWQVFYVPLFDSTEARQLRVFTRRHKAGEKRGRDSGGRFIVDVEFEALGPLQLDGLILKPRLDLILRSHDELPAALQSGIVEVFGRTCEAAGLQGKIFFQAAPTFPVAPLDEMTTSSPSDLSV